MLEPTTSLPAILELILLMFNKLSSQLPCQSCSISEIAVKAYYKHFLSDMCVDELSDVEMDDMLIVASTLNTTYRPMSLNPESLIRYRTRSFSI